MEKLIYINNSLNRYKNKRGVFAGYKMKRKAEKLLGLNNNIRIFSSTTNNGVGIGLTPNYVTGICDAEASFTVSIQKNNDFKTGWRVRPYFAINLHVKDEALLNQIKGFFGVGTISPNKCNNSVIFSVSSIEDLTNVIIPHFGKYPLITQKQADFQLFKLIVELINDKEHLTMAGLQKIVSIRASMNNGVI